MGLFLRNNKLIFIGLLFALFLRLGALFAIDDIYKPQLWEYEEIANNFLEGRGIYFTYLNTEYRATSMILYPLICASIYSVTGHSFLFVKIFQILLSLATCFLIYRISKRLFNKKIALISLGLMSFHPGLAAYSVKMHPLTLDAALFTLSVYFLLRVMDRKKILKNGIFAGIFIGLTLLTRATMGLFVPIAMLIIFFRMRDSKKDFIRSFFGISLGMVLILSPLMVRNYIVFDRVVVFPNDSGSNFWTGNNPNSVGTGYTIDSREMISSAPAAFLEKLDKLDEFGQKEAFYKDAWDHIKADPGRYLGLFAKKLYYFWWFSPTQGLNYPKLWLLVYKIYYSVILPLAILGFLTGLKIAFKVNKQMVIYVIALFCLTICLAQAMYYVEGRHRWAIEPFILIFAAYGINCLRNVRRDEIC